MKDAAVTLVQMNSHFMDATGNLSKMKNFIEEHPADIVCFPEMCLSSYSTKEAGSCALEPSDPHIGMVHDLSEETGSAIVFGFIERTGDGLYLRQDVADGKRTFTYRKCHLGQVESGIFRQGSEIPVFDVKGIRLGIHLCTESHIPDVCSTLRSKGAELVLTPFANGITGERRRDVWHSYLPARACDNGMYVMGCSAVGDNGHGTVFGGGLIALGPKGNVLGEYYGTDEKALTFDIGGKLPRDGPETMSNISYYDRRRPELYL